MKKIMHIARKYKLKVIEDLAQAFGTPLTGDIGGISFYPTKSLGAYGDAGIILTNSDKLNVKCRILRNNGSSLEEKYLHKEVGYNSRLDEIQAAVLNVRIKDTKKIKNFKYDESKYYPLPLHLQPCFRYLGYHKGDFPQSEKFAQEVKNVHTMAFQ
jgi:dTDP-4-amino-4,6-dideoxygalactose transaminase